MKRTREIAVKGEPSEIDDRRPDTVWLVVGTYPDGTVVDTRVTGHTARQNLVRRLNRNGAEVSVRRGA